MAGWWAWNMTFMFPYIGNHHPSGLILFRGVGQPPTRIDGCFILMILMVDIFMNHYIQCHGFMVGSSMVFMFCFMFCWFSLFLMTTKWITVIPLIVYVLWLVDADVFFFIIYLLLIIICQYIWSVLNLHKRICVFWTYAQICHSRYLPLQMNLRSLWLLFRFIYIYHIRVYVDANSSVWCIHVYIYMYTYTHQR